MAHAFEKRSITDEAARRMIEAAFARARELGFAVTAAVVDESGVLKAYTRMDGAPLISIGAAMKKAVTAVGFGMATGADWYNFIKDDPILLHGAPSFDNFTLLGGGLPIRVGDALVGAIGVSGGHYANDEACAQAALEALKD